MNDLLEIEGVLEKIIFHSKDSDFLIASFLSEDDRITVTGPIHRAVEGNNYRLYGEFILHKKYGEQFKIDRSEASLPRGEEAIIAFLSSRFIKGIGKAKAKSIVAMFGERTFEIIENSPDELLRVKDIGEKTVEAIIEGYAAYGHSSRVYSYFHSIGLSSKMIDSVYRLHGDKAIELFEQSPYDFARDVKGLGFLKVDKIALKNGIAQDDSQRLKMGIEHILQREASNGHVYVEKHKLISKGADLLQVESELLEEVIRDMALELTLKIDFSYQDNVYLMQNYAMEELIVEKVFSMVKDNTKTLPYKIENLIKDTEKKYDISFSDEQKKAIEGSINSSISIITGGPGTGKTTIIRGLINIFSHADMEVALTAPTGRAAKRITETTGKTASTIHRLLEYYADENQNMRFNRNFDNPLDEEVIILDEASMVDLQLMHSLMKAIKTGSRLIIVGDEDQLQSVGIGNVLGDLIECSYVPCFRLKEIFRQAKESNIIIHSHEINQGISPTFSNSREGDLFYIERMKEDEAVEIIKDLASHRLESYFPIENKIMDIQVVSPSKKGYLGNENMNRVLQELLNPPSSDKTEISIGDKVIRVGDKVMHTKNNYNIPWSNIVDHTEGKGVFNGEVGFVQEIDSEEEAIYILFDDEKLAFYDYEEAKELSLGYSMTVHKSQGSEFPVVIIPLYRVPYILSHRNLIYTAITRGKRGVVLVGDRRFLDNMVKNVNNNKRNSGLSSRIRARFERNI